MCSRKKYSKCQSRNLWTQSRSVQEKTQNPTQLGFPHFWLFIGWALNNKVAFPLSCLEVWLEYEKCLSSCKHSSSLCSWPHFLEDAQVKGKSRFYIFNLQASSKKDWVMDWVMPLWNDVMDRNICLIILWAESQGYVLYFRKSPSMLHYNHYINTCTILAHK